MTDAWTPHDTRDQVIDFIHRWGAERTGLRPQQIAGWVGIARSKFYDWRARYGKANEHNSWIPRDHWIEDWERKEIVKFHHDFPLEGYRRLTFMMLDRDVVAVSPSTTYRVLKPAGSSRAGRASLPRKAPDLCNRSNLTSTGMWMSPTSMWPGRFTTSVRYSTDALAPSFTTSCASP